jgi:hypothetical protein
VPRTEPAQDARAIRQAPRRARVPLLPTRPGWRGVVLSSRRAGWPSGASSASLPRQMGRRPQARHRRRTLEHRACAGMTRTHERPQRTVLGLEGRGSSDELVVSETKNIKYSCPICIGSTSECVAMTRTPLITSSPPGSMNVIGASIAPRPPAMSFSESCTRTVTSVTIQSRRSVSRDTRDTTRTMPATSDRVVLYSSSSRSGHPPPTNGPAVTMSSVTTVSPGRS